MATYIYQGSTPVIRFRPINGVSVADPSLGTPTIAISQEDLSFFYEGEQLTIDAVNNTVSTTLPEADTIRLVDGVPAYGQLIFSNETTSNVVKFPIHELTVLQSLVDTLVTPEDVPEEDDGTDEEGIPYDYPEPEVDGGELIPADDPEIYQLEDYEETYTSTLEDDPEDLQDISDVEPAETEE